jgi:hypothetical protein
MPDLAPHTPINDQPADPAAGEPLPADLGVLADQPEQAVIEQQTGREQRRPSWLRRNIGRLALVGITSLGVVGGTAGLDAEPVHAAASYEYVMKDRAPSKPGREAKPAVSAEKKQYQEARVQVFDTPFVIESGASSEKTVSEKFMIEPALAAHQAEFQTAVQLSSGIKINFYRSALDDQTEPAEIDPKALEVLVNQLIKEAASIPNNPYAAAVAELQTKAATGGIDLRLSFLLVSDESKCLDSSSTSRYLEMVQRNATSCSNGGATFRYQKSIPATNQFIVVADVASTYKPDYMYDYYAAHPEQKFNSLTPSKTFTLIAAHEITHALIYNTSQNGLLSAEEEHAQFTDPLEAQIYEYMASLNKQDAKYVTPFFVDTQKTSSLY